MSHSAMNREQSITHQSGEWHGHCSCGWSGPGRVSAMDVAADNARHACLPEPSDIPQVTIEHGLWDWPRWLKRKAERRKRAA